MMKVAILRFLGTNCEFDVGYALDKLQVAYEYVWFKDAEIPKGTSLVIVPGGFSYGDYLRSGAIARFAPVMRAVVDYAKGGGRVLGICNGFQILVESGLLPGALMRNHQHCFVAKWVDLRVRTTQNAFLSSYAPNQILSIPIAHAEGCYYIDDEGYRELEENDQILLSYVNNPNGSIESIAGVCNKEKTIFGLMPHPERAIEKELGGSDGLDMLRNLVC